MLRSIFQTDIKNSFEISSPGQTRQQNSPHTWAHTLTGITQIYLVFGWKSPIGSLGNHPFTYSRAQGRTHGKLSGKVSRNVFLESPCRRTRWALQSNSDTLNPTYTRRVSEQISKSVKSVSAEADSLNKITQMSQETKLDCLWMTSPCCSYMIQTHTQRWVLFFFSLGCLFKKDCGSKQENDMTRKTKWNQTE